MESDFLGQLPLPASVPWGIATARAVQNSGLGFVTLGHSDLLLRGLLEVKWSAAMANRDLGAIDPQIAQAIVDAAEGLLAAPRPDEFPLEVVQGGGGTALHINVNEVLAHHATADLRDRGHKNRVHPLDHVNRCQSTNDVFPTAVSIAALAAIDRVVPAVERVALSLDRLASRYEGVSRLGRSCLMDAVPLPISAFHRAQATALRQRLSGLVHSRMPLLHVPLGGTAVGTGLGAVAGFDTASIRYLAEHTGYDFTPSSDRFDAIASLESIAQVMTAIEAVARVLGRIAGDLRILAAGPRGGMGEVVLPVVQAGSSIMPGKVNPVLPELVVQASFRIAGAAHTVALASSTAEIDVTPMGPIAIAEVLRAADMLTRTATLFTTQCLNELAWDLDRVEENLLGSYQSAVEYATVHGYDSATVVRTGQLLDDAGTDSTSAARADDPGPYGGPEL